MTIEYLNGINDMDLVTISQFFIGSFSDDRIHMDRINSFYIRMFIQNPPNRSEHIVHRLAKIFSSMRSNKNHPTVAYPIQFRMMVIRNYCMLHGVNHGIPRHINRCCIFPLVQQMLFCQFSGSKIILSE